MTCRSVHVVSFPYLCFLDQVYAICMYLISYISHAQYTLLTGIEVRDHQLTMYFSLSFHSINLLWRFWARNAFLPRQGHPEKIRELAFSSEKNRCVWPGQLSPLTSHLVVIHTIQQILIVRGDIVRGAATNNTRIIWSVTMQPSISPATIQHPCIPISTRTNKSNF